MLVYWSVTIGDAFQVCGSFLTAKKCRKNHGIEMIPKFNVSAYSFNGGLALATFRRSGQEIRNLRIHQDMKTGTPEG